MYVGSKSTCILRRFLGSVWLWLGRGKGNQGGKYKEKERADNCVSFPRRRAFAHIFAKRIRSIAGVYIWASDTHMYTQIYTHTQQLKALLSRTGLVPGESLLSVGLNSEGGPPICLQLAPYCTSFYVLICRPTRHPIHTSHTLSLWMSPYQCAHSQPCFIHTQNSQSDSGQNTQRNTKSAAKNIQCSHCQKKYIYIFFLIFLSCLEISKHS